MRTTMNPSTPQLAGLRVLLTRAAADNRLWAEALQAAGAHVETLACIATQFHDQSKALEAASEGADWLVLNSRRAVHAIAPLNPTTTRARRSLSALKIACVGPATRLMALQAFGHCELLAANGTLADLAHALRSQFKRPTTLLLPSATEGRDDLEQILEPAGHTVHRIAVYTTQIAAPLAERLAFTDCDAVVLTSPSALQGLLNQRTLANDHVLITLGPTTSEAARAAGLTRIVEAPTRDLDGVLAALDSLRPESK